ncbi:MAG: response regulator [Ferruginibacter sp.]
MKKKLNCILLIDDDEPTNYISKMLIEEAGCASHIEIAQSGQKALDYLTSSEHLGRESKSFPCPDLIFLDINMPAMNGWEFLQKYNILEQHHKGEIIMVMLTTSLNPDDEAKANKTPDISGFESKPLTAEKLNNILKKYFSANF